MATQRSQSTSLLKSVPALRAAGKAAPRALSRRNNNDFQGKIAPAPGSKYPPATLAAVAFLALFAFILLASSNSPTPAYAQDSSSSDIALHADNGIAYGIWSDGTTIWAADFADDKLYAYALADGTRQDGSGVTTNKEFALPSDNDAPRGIWSDGTAIWVGDFTDGKIYAYALADGTRQANKEFALPSDNGALRGIWSDGATIWVADSGDDKLYAYALDGGARQANKEFALHSDNGNPQGIWSDGDTMWVSDSTRDKLYAYALAGGTRRANLDLSLDSDNGDPWGIWSDGTTIWVSDGRDAKLYAYALPAAAATPPTLTGLTVSAGTLTPAFAGGTLDYTVPDVPNATGRITVTATPESGATIAYEDGAGNTLTDVDSTTDGDQFDLEVGENTVKVKVTKGDASQTYTLTVTRAAPAASSDASLSGLALSGVTLSPDFAAATTSYTASVYNSVTSTTVTAEQTDDDAKVVITPVDADLSAEGYQVSLNVGSNVVSVKVTAEDGTTTRTYTVTVTRAANSVTVVVSAPQGVEQGTRKLEITWVDTQDCAAGYTAYVAIVKNGVVIVAQKVPDDTASTADVITRTFSRLATINQTQVWCGERGTGRMVGEVAMTLDPDNEDRPIPGTYTTAAADSAAPPALSGLTVSAGTLTPVFAGGTLEYAVPDVPNAGSRITVTATADADVTVAYEDGSGNALSDVDSTTDGDQFDLEVGENTIKVKVTKGDASQTYTLKVTRAAPPASSDASLSGLALSGVTLSPDFAAATTAYTASVYNSVTSTTVTAAANDDGASYTVKLDGAANSDGVIPLAVGSNVITVEVTAEDGETAKTYTVTVTRAAPPLSTDATLSGLTLSGVDIGSFVPATAGYAASVANDVTETTVTATVNDGGASYTVKLDGVADSDGVIPLAVGSNVITVEVTAEDGETARTYTVTVTRAAPPLSKDATLNGLALSDAPFTFTLDTTSYEVNVAHDVAQTTVTATANADGATYAIRLGGAADADGVIPLAVGSNVITVEVTAEDGNTARTYTVTVTRAAPPLSTDATLSGLALGGVDFGTFDPATTGYTAGVANGVDEATVTPTVNDDGASYLIKLGGVADADGTVSLAVGSNVIAIEVTAEDGKTARTYTVTVTRAAPPLSNDATLSSLTLSDAPFTFASDTTSYEVNVAQDVDQTTVTATVNDDGASYTVKLAGVTDADGTVSLAVGGNVITIEVTAEDGETAKTYTVTVSRAAPDEPEPEPPPSSPPDAPERLTGEVTGRGQVRLDWNDAAGAEFYQVRFCCGNQDWVELPTDGIEIVIDGSGATLSNLPDYGTYHFSVRAGNAAGVSGWSESLQLSNAT